MKTVIKERNNLCMILEILWAIIILVGTSYLVFYKGINGWWFVLSVYLMTFSVSKKRTEIED